MKKQLLLIPLLLLLAAFGMSGRAGAAGVLTSISIDGESYPQPNSSLPLPLRDITLHYDDGTVGSLEARYATWTSDNPSIVSIDGRSFNTYGIGDATLTATYQGFTATLLVQVREPIQFTAFSVKKHYLRNGIYLYHGAVSATLSDQYTNAPIVGKLISFTFGDGSSYCDAVTDASGTASCKGHGSAQYAIFATYVGDNYYSPARISDVN